MTDYWLADADAKILGPVNVEVITDMAQSGKLKGVRAVSRDGRAFAPLQQFPEVANALSARPAQPDKVNHAEMLERIETYLAELKSQSTHEIFHVPEGAPPSQVRAAFFGLIKRFYPDRLPASVPPELRKACEDVFLYLSARMVEFENPPR